MDVYELIGSDFVPEMSELGYTTNPLHPRPMMTGAMGGTQIPIPADIRERIPKVIEFHDPLFITTDYVEGIWPPAVSQRFRDIVESLEPGVHEFIPVDVRFSANPERVGEPMYLLSIAVYETGIDIEKSEKQMRTPPTMPAGYEHLVTKPYDRTPYPTLVCEKGRGKVFDDDVIRGRHLWKFHHRMALWHPVFASAELVEAVKGEGLIGPRFVLCEKI